MNEHRAGDDVMHLGSASLPERCVVVVTYNSAGDIAACLSALNGEKILVIDNASSDDTADIAAGVDGNIQVIVNSSNVGFGVAANQGMTVAGDRDVILVNPDVLLTSHAIDKMASTVQRNHAGLVAPQLVNRDGTVQESARSFPSVPRLLARRTPVGRTAMGGRWLRDYLAPSRSSGTAEIDWVIGAVMYLPRSTIGILGGFDEQFFLYGEDVDLCARSWRAGLPVVLDGRVQAVHSYNRGSKRTFDLRCAETRHHWVSILRLAKRYPRQFFNSRPMARGLPDGATTSTLEWAERSPQSRDSLRAGPS